VDNLTAAVVDTVVVGTIAMGVGIPDLLNQGKTVVVATYDTDLHSNCFLTPIQLRPNTQGKQMGETSIVSISQIKKKYNNQTVIKQN
jgi:hypothetical protein